MIEELHVFFEQERIGRILRDRRRDRLGFRYDEDWASNPRAFPLSLSLPLSAIEHGPAMVSSFLWGLLPDNDEVLRRWGRKFGVSAHNVFALLWHVGEDCAGAVQFFRPDQAEKWRIGSPAGRVVWLSEREVGERMEQLTRDHSASRLREDAGQFSLAGAQPKTALYYDEESGRWGVPSGRIPTTHILKPATGTFDGFAENEHFCLRLAHALGLAAADSAVRYFGDTPVVVVERYDRLRRGRRVIRIHQEDMCQALGCPPQQKYQSQGGPSAAQILSLLRQYSSDRAEDEKRFINSLILTWLIGATDGHAKNFSVLIEGRAQVRLAPLYDLSSALPYPKVVDLRRAGLALKIGGSYRLQGIGAHQWEKFALEMRVPLREVRERIMDMIDQLPEAAREVGEALESEGLDHPVIGLLVKEISARAALCRKQLKT